MTEKQTYWIADAEGVKAKVSGAEARDEWTKVRGWSETTEPTGQEFQWIRNADHGGKGVMNHEAVLLHEGLGWFPSGPEGYDEPTDSPAAPAPAPASTKPAANANSGDKKE
jgi:hypothetical protein